MIRVLFLLVLFAVPLASAAPKKVLLVGQSSDGHPYGTHEFMAGVRVVDELLKPFGDKLETATTRADEPWKDGPQMIDTADAIVLLVTQGARWMQTDAERYAAFKRFAARKGALIALHWSIGAKDEQYIKGQLELLGGTRGGPQRKYIILENDVRLKKREHPILRGLSDFRIKDEFYYRLDLIEPSPAFHPLLTTVIDGNEETIGWAWERPDGGRSFGYVGLHFHDNWSRAEYRRLVTQAILWTLELPIPSEGVGTAIDEKILALPPAPAKSRPSP